MNDAFLLTLGTVCIAILIVLLLIRSPRKKAATGSVDKEGKGSAETLATEQSGEEPVMVH